MNEPKSTKTEGSGPVNNGFWDKPAIERSQRMESACEHFGVASFWDLSPEERGRAYDQEELK